MLALFFRNLFHGKRPSWQEIKDDWRHAKIGVKRVAVHGFRGRVYESKTRDQPPQIQVGLGVRLRVKPTRVYRAADNTWYDIPSGIKSQNQQKSPVIGRM